jgi:hypothetical protein
MLPLGWCCSFQMSGTWPFSHKLNSLGSAGIEPAPSSVGERVTKTGTTIEFESFCYFLRVAALFIKQEEENFALFNYVNELNNECEMLKDQVKELTGKKPTRNRVI